MYSMLLIDDSALLLVAFVAFVAFAVSIIGLYIKELGE